MSSKRSRAVLAASSSHILMTPSLDFASAIWSTSEKIFRISSALVSMAMREGPLDVMPECEWISCVSGSYAVRAGETTGRM
jgi:hypothetical protein